MTTVFGAVGFGLMRLQRIDELAEPRSVVWVALEVWVASVTFHVVTPCRLASAGAAVARTARAAAVRARWVVRSMPRTFAPTPGHGIGGSPKPGRSSGGQPQLT